MYFIYIKFFAAFTDTYNVFLDSGQHFTVASYRMYGTGRVCFTVLSSLCIRSMHMLHKILSR